MNKSFLEANQIDYYNLETGPAKIDQTIERIQTLTKNFQKHINSNDFPKLIQILVNLKFIRDLMEFKKYQFDLNDLLNKIWQNKIDESQFFKSQLKIQQRLIKTTQFGKKIPLPNQTDLKTIIKIHESTDYQIEFKLTMKISNIYEPSISISNLNKLKMIELKKLAKSKTFNANEQECIKWHFQQKKLEELHFKKLRQWFISMYNPESNPNVELNQSNQLNVGNKLYVPKNFNNLDNQIMVNLTLEELQNFLF